jgi:hypothetical protein
MQPHQEIPPQSSRNAYKPQKQTKATDQSTPAPLAPKYNDAGIYATRPNPSTQPTRKPRSNPSPSNQPISAAALNAVMATSSSSTDKMHSKSSSSRKVDDWNEDSTYKSRLASMVGNTRKWNYFGADIGGNPFRRKKR